MRDRWTTADFETLSWHDCHVYGLRLLNLTEELGTADLELDIDFIVEWIHGESPIHFRVAPATLIFHEVFGLRVEIDYAQPTAGMTPFSLDGIQRQDARSRGGHVRYAWRLPINWPAGEISFESPGFTQTLRREPVLVARQVLATERG